MLSEKQELSLQRIKELRREFEYYVIDGYIVPAVDAYGSEYPPACNRRLEWISGFTGSAGIALILQNEAVLFTDGRYMLQAKHELDPNIFQVININQQKPWEWLASKKNPVLGYDPWLHPKKEIASYDKVIPITPNMIDRMWHDRPAHPTSEMMVYPESYAGKSSKEKIALVIETMDKHQASYCMLTASDSICWLLNMRGNDVPFTPLILGFALIHRTGKVEWFVEGMRSTELLPMQVQLQELIQLEPVLHQIRDERILLDLEKAPIWFSHVLRQIVDVPDPCLLPKAIKNETEIAHIKNAHVTDGIAVTRFLRWLDQAVAEGKTITELSAARRLYAYREEGELFKNGSFDTISGFGANGAIVHYRVTEETNATFKPDNLYLVDSGGQYLGGTTDITRTVVIGTPTPEQQYHFTLVLKGHIALAKAIFKKGTTGSDLDKLARGPLQKAGLDYDHGTGHGVGAYLCVHEGPHRISKAKNNVALVPGMVVSNEPGYYKEGAYGIRIESLILVVDKSAELGPDMLGFETLTLVPIDTRLIDMSLLTAEEQAWLTEYHERVQTSLGI